MLHNFTIRGSSFAVKNVLVEIAHSSCEGIVHLLMFGGCLDKMSQVPQVHLHKLQFSQFY